MGHKLNLKGRKFEHLLVLEECAERKRGAVIWKCQCDCGNIVYASSKQLAFSEIRSCGCKGRKYTDLARQTFGRMTVLSATSKRDKDNSIIWECQCECGNRKELSTRELKSKTLDGCGCKRTKHIKEINKLYQGTSIRQITDKKNRKNNTSGVKGVHKHSKNNSYVAHIKFQNKFYYLGSYKTLEEAAEARRRAEERLYTPIIESYEKEKNNERI